MTQAETHPTTWIDIGVCTFRRPHDLRQTLLSLSALDVPAHAAIRIIVADNDEGPSARELVESMAEQSPFAITYVHCPKGNISIARNACLAESDGEFLAFIDDDEVAAPQWLTALYSEAMRSGADAVLGPVRAIYGDDAPTWMTRGDFHSTLPVWVKGDIRTGYTCNVLLDMRSRHLSGRRFDLGLGQSGGEDTAFFSAMTASGGRISYARDAWLEEPVPAKRASFDWLAKRRFRSGQTHGRILAERQPGTRRVLNAFVASAKFGVCGLLSAAFVAMPVTRNRYALRATLHAGAVSGLLGVREIRQYGLLETS